MPPTVFKTDERQDLSLAGSIPVRLRDSGLPASNRPCLGGTGPHRAQTGPHRATPGRTEPGQGGAGAVQLRP